jgi:hypothetical protein
LISSISLDVEMINNPSTWKDPFNLGFSSYLRKNGPDVKPDLSIVVAFDPSVCVESLAICTTFVENPAIFGIRSCRFYS